MSEAEVQIGAAEVAARLGVSGTGLRRLADIYAEVHGDLHRDPKTNNRIWTTLAMNRLETARSLLHSGRADSIKNALMAAAEGVEPSVESISIPSTGGVQAAAWSALAQRFQELERNNEEMKGRLQELLELNRALARQLEAPKDDHARDIELREQRRLNQYLLGELERRSKLDMETPRRRTWWRWWSP